MKKAISIVLAVVLVLALGYTIGKHQTIRQAELIDTTDTEYHIGFGDQIHTYTFE